MPKIYIAEVSVQPISCPDQGSFPAALPFPLDMLRYDALYPASQDCVSTISLTLARDYRVWDARDFPIRLRGRVDSPKWQPARARWESFGWLVTNCRVEAR